MDHSRDQRAHWTRCWASTQPLGCPWLLRTGTTSTCANEAALWRKGEVSHHHPQLICSATTSFSWGFCSISWWQTGQITPQVSSLLEFPAARNAWEDRLYTSSSTCFPARTDLLSTGGRCQRVSGDKAAEKLGLFCCSLHHPMDHHHLHSPPAFREASTHPGPHQYICMHQYICTQLCSQAWRGIKLAAESHGLKCEPRQTQLPKPLASGPFLFSATSVPAQGHVIPRKPIWHTYTLPAALLWKFQGSFFPEFPQLTKPMLSVSPTAGTQAVSPSLPSLFAYLITTLPLL